MDMKEVCRTCLQPSESLISIFDSIRIPNLEFTKFPILELLKIFTEISVSPYDGLPGNICTDCFDKIRQSYAFKLKFQKSEVIFKQLTENEKNVDETIKKEHSEYEYYTEVDIELIKLENTEDYAISRDDQLEFASGASIRQVFPVQEVKQEPEIVIMDEEDFNGPASNDKCFKSDLQCPLCRKIFKIKYNLKVHMIIHTKEKPYQCKVCLKKFRTKGNLTIHTKIVHGDKTTKNFKCKICSKLHISELMLNRHIRTHSEEKPFECKICSKSCRYKGNLIVHMQKFHGDGSAMKFKCTTCSKLYLCESELNRHMIMHTEERPFQCEVCQKSFRYKCHLTVHMKSHSDNQHDEFKCETCSKFFTCKRSLIRHTRIHTGEKPFHCEFCSSKFLYKHYMQDHVRSMHGVESDSSKQT